MMRCLRKERGFALVAALGITVLLVIYLVSVRGAAEMTRARGRQATREQEVAEAMASLATLALASREAASTEPLQLPGGREGRFTRESLPAEAPFWRTAPLLRHQAGDELLTAEVKDGKTRWRARFVINRRGTRPGSVTVEAAAPVLKAQSDQGR